MTCIMGFFSTFLRLCLASPFPRICLVFPSSFPRLFLVIFDWSSSKLINRLPTSNNLDYATQINSTHTYTRTYIYTCTYTLIYTCTYTHIYTCTWPVPRARIRNVKETFCVRPTVRVMSITLQGSSFPADSHMSV